MGANGKLRLLIVEQHQEDAELLVAELVRAGFEPSWLRVDTMADLIDRLYPAPDVILCDHGTPGLDALDVLSTLRRHRVEPPVIVVSGHLDEEICVKTLRMGAVDYLLKDRLARLGPAVDHALVIQRLRIEKRDAERKERETAGILRGLVAHAPAAISVKSVDGSYLLANRQFETLRGVAPGELIGRLDADVFPVQQARRMTELDARCLQDSVVLEREEELVEASGPRNLLGVRYPVINETGEVFGIGSIYLDITRQKQVEAQLRESQAKVPARAGLASRAELPAPVEVPSRPGLPAPSEVLGARIEQLRELDRLKAEFADAVSHGLRTPLTSIRGYLELLGEDDVDLAAELAHRCLEVIDRKSEHLMGLVEDLLTLSRVDSGNLAAPGRSVCVPAVVSSAVSILRPTVEQAGLGLSVRLDEAVPAVTGDRDQLERVVMNLLSNAVTLSAAGAGDIEVSVTRQDEVVSLMIRSAAVRVRGISGHGLRLAVVKGIVDGHGGTVSATSTPGGGTTIIVRLPAEV